MNELNQVEIAQRLFSAIDIIVDRKLEKVKYDVTLVAEIIEVGNPFKLKQQDLIFEAYPLYQSDFKVGDRVSVLVPSNDFRKKKYILGLVAAAPAAQTRTKSNESAPAPSLLDAIEDLAYGRINSAQEKIRRLKEEEQNE